MKLILGTPVCRAEFELEKKSATQRGGVLSVIEVYVICFPVFFACLVFVVFLLVVCLLFPMTNFKNIVVCFFFLVFSCSCFLSVFLSYDLVLFS